MENMNVNHQCSRWVLMYCSVTTKIALQLSQKKKNQTKTPWWTDPAFFSHYSKQIIFYYALARSTYFTAQIWSILLNFNFIRHYY